MKQYELTYLISANLSDEDIKSLSEKVISCIQENGNVSVIHPIKRKVDYFLATLDFSSIPEKIAEIDKKLKQNPGILRYMLLTKKAPTRDRIRVSRKFAKELPIKPEKPKVELKEIEKKLDEILGEI